VSPARRPFFMTFHKCSILCRPQRQHRAGRKRTRFHLLRVRRPGAVA
jgi:hypothetical protein